MSMPNYRDRQKSSIVRIAREILAAVPVEEGAKEKERRYERGPAFDTLAGERERLAGALSAR